jgi:hypothetical protein
VYAPKRRRKKFYVALILNCAQKQQRLVREKSFEFFFFCDKSAKGVRIYCVSRLFVYAQKRRKENFNFMLLH